jgi:hypothetical protein
MSFFKTNPLMYAELFEWALEGITITAEEARQCASRSTGRPWMAHWDRIHALGAFASVMYTLVECRIAIAHSGNSAVDCTQLVYNSLLSGTNTATFNIQPA